VAAWFLRTEQSAVIAFALAGLLMLVLGASFHHLTVADEGQQLVIWFGPLPLFWRRIWYDDIREFKKDRTTILDGWGIHLSLRGGWVWNIWGRDCVLLRLRQGSLRIGTDDAEALVRFLEDRLPRDASKVRP
jgi:hypothetical protein